MIGSPEDEETNMTDFDLLWRFVCQRSACFPVVQEYNELKHVFELMQGCESYLEVGAAEGNSLYVLAHALKPGAQITYIDWDEKHTRVPREEIIRLLKEEGYSITSIHANTMHREAIEKASMRRYDIVLIDAGHTYDEVLADAYNYAPLADKYVCFHDVQLSEVNVAFEFYQKKTGWPAYRVINSATFGYGILCR